MEATVENFRRLLLLIPQEFEYDHRRIKQIRTCLRDFLFKVATVNGKYMDWISDNGIPAKDIKPEDWIAHEKTHSHYGRPCVRKLRRGEPTFRCLTCGLDETCVLCKFCFNEADHVDHNVFVKIGHRDDGGICDCGDQEAWKAKLHCKAEQELDSFQQVPDELAHSLLECFSIALDFVIDVFSSAHPSLQFYNTAEQVYANERDAELDEEVYGMKDTQTNKYVLSLWNDDRRSVQDAVLAIRVATGRPHDFGCMVANEVDGHGRARLAVSSDCNRLILQKSTIKLFTSTIRSVRDFIREEMSDEIIRWLNDISQAQLRNCDPTLLTRLVGEALANPWRVGNKYIRSEAGSEGPLPSGIVDFPVSVLKPDYALPIWRHALLNGQNVPTVDTLPHVNINIPVQDESSEMTLRTMSYGALQPLQSIDTLEMSDNMIPYSPIWHDTPKCISEPGPDARVKYLLFFDVRLWKTLRSVLCDLYLTSMVSNAELKAKLGAIYAGIYPVIAELYVMTDREPEVSIITSLSTQLFTTPSIATELSVGSHFSRYFAALFTLFDKNQVASASTITTDARLQIQSPIFRNRRLGQLFHEIEFLLNRNTNKVAVVGSPYRMRQAADFLSLFQSLTPMIRQLDTHVEYENETWVYFFTTMPFVHQLANAIASGALECTFDQVRESISCISALMIRWSYRTIVKVLIESKVFEYNSLMAQYGGKDILCNYNAITVDRHPVSLHHPVHVFLSWFIEYSRVPTLADLRDVLFSQVDNIKKEIRTDVPAGLLEALVFDSSIRTMGLLSQIHVGLWVRNGYAVRSQLTHYRETTLRDLAYSRDIFMTQVALVSLEPNAAFVQLLQRYNMIDWRNDSLFDEDQRYYMLEEFLHLLTFLLTDRLHLLGLDEITLKERLFEREIIQCLTFHAMSFSEMTKTIPESMLVCEDLFELVLKRCADFVPPKGVRDVGVYTLKPEYLQKFDTHYTHFSQAKMDDAEQRIVEKLSLLTGVPKAQIVHLPPLEKLSEPWCHLGGFTKTVVFARFMYDLFEPFTEEKVSEDPERSASGDSSKKSKSAAARDHSETVVGKALYLLLVAAQDDLDTSGEIENNDEMFPSISAWASVPNERGGASFIDLLQRLLQKSQYHTLHPRIQRLFQLLHQKSPLNIPSISASVNDSGESEAERKKRKGKEMRAKAMEELRRQQALFSMQTLENMDDGDDDDLGDDSEMAMAEDGSQDGVAWEYPTSQCVLCQLPDNEDSIFGIMTYITDSRTARTQPLEDEYWLGQAYSADTSSLDTKQNTPSPAIQTRRWKEIQGQYVEKIIGPAFPNEHSDISQIVTGCGHGVHFKCYQEHIQQQRQRPGLTRATPENVSKVEYLCALCRGLNNAFMPVMWKPNRLSAHQYLQLSHSVHDAFSKVLRMEEGQLPPGSLIDVIKHSFKELQPRFVEAFAESQGFDYSFSHEVHAAVLVSIMRLTSNQPKPTTSMGTNRILTRAYSATVASMEIALRGVSYESSEGGLVIDQLSQQSLQFLRVLTQFLRNMLGVSIKRQLDNEPANSEFQKSYPLFVGYKHNDFEVAPFDTFVESLFIAGPMFDLEPSALLRIYESSLIWQFIRWVRNVPSLDVVSAPATNCQIEGLLASMTPHNPRVVYAMLDRHVTVGLRRAALVIHGLCGVYDPNEYNGIMHFPESERLSKFLLLPELQSAIIEQMRPEYGPLWEDIKLVPPPFGGLHQLIQLPERLDMFFNDPEHTELPSDPTVCLFCGAIMGVQTFERDRGPCNRHIAQCMEVYGMFLQPKRNMLLYLLPDQRGSFTEAPYLDLHGEVDEHMRRGRPHYLQVSRYDNITRTIWLENGIASFIARKLDATTNQGGWETL